MSLDQFKQEVLSEPQKVLVRNQLKNIGYRAHLNQPNVLARAYALESLFSHCKVQLYPHDRVAGSLLGIMWPQQEAESLPSVPDYAGNVFGERSFVTNADHYGPDYQTILNSNPLKEKTMIFLKNRNFCPLLNFPSAPLPICWGDMPRRQEPNLRRWNVRRSVKRWPAPVRDWPPALPQKAFTRPLP